MSTLNLNLIRGVVLTLAVLLSSEAHAQTTAFSYQGKLTDNGSPANGQYDFQFKLFDTATVGAGTQQGSTFPVSNLMVTEGTFTVQLDFGAAVFSGPARFLEIAVKKISDPNFTALSPRQQVAASPYAIHTLNADGLSVACVGCITSSQIQSVQGSQVAGNISGNQISGAIPVASLPAGSASYIQNGTGQQAATNFNISGNGTIGGNLNVNGALSLNIVNAQTQFNLAGNRVLAAPGTSNLFAGINAGAANTTGDSNSLFGVNAGQMNTTGVASTFIGSNAGQNNTASFNTFVGSSAGLNNTTGGANSFFGQGAGLFNTSGNFNSLFGTNAGNRNTTGHDNAFYGNDAGFNNTTGLSNAFFGRSAGVSNTTGRDNSFFGFNAGSSNTTSSANSFFGSGVGAVTTGSANAFFGASTGLSNTTGNHNSFFGFGAGFANTTGDENSFFGTGAGQSNTTGRINSFVGQAAGTNNTTGGGNSFFGSFAGSSNTTGSNNTFIGGGAGTPDFSTQVNFSTAIGAGARVSTSNTIVLGTTSEKTLIPGKVVMGGGGGAIGGGDAEVFNTGVIEGIFTGNVVLYQLSTLTPSPVHVCTIATQVGNGFGGDALTRCTSSSSSVKNKTNAQPFSSGLDVINRLKPIAFKWKGGGSDFGLNAEEVAEVEPLFVTRNDKGEVEDVKEGSLDLLFINAFKEQQAQIKQQHQEIETLKKRQQDFDVLKALVCSDHPDVAPCKSN